MLMAKTPARHTAVGQRGACLRRCEEDKSRLSNALAACVGKMCGQQLGDRLTPKRFVLLTPAGTNRKRGQNIANTETGTESLTTKVHFQLRITHCHLHMQRGNDTDFGRCHWATWRAETVGTPEQPNISKELEMRSLPCINATGRAPIEKSFVQPPIPNGYVETVPSDLSTHFLQAADVEKRHRCSTTSGGSQANMWPGKCSTTPADMLDTTKHQNARSPMSSRCCNLK